MELLRGGTLAERLRYGLKSLDNRELEQGAVWGLRSTIGQAGTLREVRHVIKELFTGLEDCQVASRRQRYQLACSAVKSCPSEGVQRIVGWVMKQVVHRLGEEVQQAVVHVVCELMAAMVDRVMAHTVQLLNGEAEEAVEDMPQSWLFKTLIHPLLKEAAGGVDKSKVGMAFSLLNGVVSALRVWTHVPGVVPMVMDCFENTVQAMDTGTVACHVAEAYLPLQRCLEILGNHVPPEIVSSAVTVCLQGAKERDDPQVRRSAMDCLTAAAAAVQRHVRTETGTWSLKMSDGLEVLIAKKALIQEALVNARYDKIMHVRKAAAAAKAEMDNIPDSEPKTSLSGGQFPVSATRRTASINRQTRSKNSKTTQRPVSGTSKKENSKKGVKPLAVRKSARGKPVSARGKPGSGRGKPASGRDKLINDVETITEDNISKTKEEAKGERMKQMEGEKAVLRSKKRRSRSKRESIEDLQDELITPPAGCSGKNGLSVDVGSQIPIHGVFCDEAAQSQLSGGKLLTNKSLSIPGVEEAGHKGIEGNRHCSYGVGCSISPFCETGVHTAKEKRRSKTRVKYEEAEADVSCRHEWSRSENCRSPQPDVTNETGTSGTNHGQFADAGCGLHQECTALKNRARALEATVGNNADYLHQQSIASVPVLPSQLEASYSDADPYYDDDSFLLEGGPTEKIAPAENADLDALQQQLSQVYLDLDRVTAGAGETVGLDETNRLIRRAKELINSFAALSSSHDEECKANAAVAPLLALIQENSELKGEAACEDRLVAEIGADPEPVEEGVVGRPSRPRAPDLNEADDNVELLARASLSTGERHPRALDEMLAGLTPISDLEEKLDVMSDSSVDQSPGRGCASPEHLLDDAIAMLRQCSEDLPASNMQEEPVSVSRNTSVLGLDPRHSGDGPSCSRDMQQTKTLDRSSVYDRQELMRNPSFPSSAGNPSVYDRRGLTRNPSCPPSTSSKFLTCSEERTNIARPVLPSSQIVKLPDGAPSEVVNWVQKCTNEVTHYYKEREELRLKYMEEQYRREMDNLTSMYERQKNLLKSATERAIREEVDLFAQSCLPHVIGMLGSAPEIRLQERSAG